MRGAWAEGCRTGQVWPGRSVARGICGQGDLWPGLEGCVGVARVGGGVGRAARAALAAGGLL